MNTFTGAVGVIVVGLIGGIAVGLQGPMSGVLSQKIGPMGSSLIIHIGGAILSAVLLPFLGGLDFKTLRTVPVPYLFAGLLGVVLYLTLAYTLPRVGAAVTVSLLILAQLTIGLVLDHFGWLGLDQHPISLARLAGVVALLLGAYLISR